MQETFGLRKLVVCAFVIAVAFASYGTAATVRAEIDSPVVIGDQVFPSGQLRISEVSASLMAVMLDGQRIALLHSPARGSSSSPASMAFRRDAQGRLHLVGLNFRERDGKRLVQLDVASVARGMETIHARPAGAIAMATPTHR